MLCTVFATAAGMRTVTLPLPVFGFVVATRVALAAGVGLLVADRLPPERRRIVGLTLAGVGVLATIPAAKWLSRGFRRRAEMRGVHSDPRLIGATRLPRKGDDDY